MSSIISSHNERILRPRTTEHVHDEKKFPIAKSMSYTESNIYQSDVKNNENKGTKTYFGLAEAFFKERFWNHNRDIKHEQYKKSTELSKYMCSLNKEQIMCRIRWSILKKVYVKTKINFCPLWLAEKVHFIIEHSDNNQVLNKKNEFINRPRNQVKLLLKSFRRE